MAEKKCGKCKIIQSLNMFIGTQNKIIGTCKTCMKDDSDIIPYIYKCNKCNIEKTIDRFITNNDKFIKICRDCTKEVDPEPIPEGMKKCSRDRNHPIYPIELNSNSKEKGCPLCKDAKKASEIKNIEAAASKGIIKCTSCSINSKDNNITEFEGNPNGGYYKQCIECRERKNNNNRKTTKKNKKNKDDPKLATENKRYCSGCGHPHDLSRFANDDGTISDNATCTRRLKRDRYRYNINIKNIEFREKRNANFRNKRYDKSYRERKREELGDVAYKKLMTDQHNDWVHRNLDRVTNYQKNTISICIARNKSYAAKRGILWDITDEDIEFMAVLPCFYCGIEYTDQLHNPNRLDNTKGFIRSNTVPACSTCALMKKALDINTFIERCEYISGLRLVRNEEIWHDIKYVNYKKYKDRAENKGIEFSITEEEFNILTREKCIYCNKEKTDTHTNGIDRYDNSIGYVFDNCVSCCFECNTMKWQFTYDKFMDQCKKIGMKKHRYIENIVPNNRSAIRNTTLLREHNIVNVENTKDEIDDIDDIDNTEGIIILEQE